MILPFLYTCSFTDSYLTSHLFSYLVSHFVSYSVRHCSTYLQFEQLKYNQSLDKHVGCLLCFALILIDSLTLFIRDSLALLETEGQSLLSLCLFQLAQIQKGELRPFLFLFFSSSKYCWPLFVIYGLHLKPW